MSARIIALGFCASVFAFVADARPLSVEDMEKYSSVAGISMSLEGDLLVGMVHSPGSNGMEQAVASWDISGAIDTSTPLVPRAITPGNERMRLVGAQALKGGIVQVIGSQAWSGPTVGCLEGRTTGAERTFVNQIYTTDITLADFKEPFFRPSARRTNAAMEQCMRLQASTTQIRNMLPNDPDHIVVSRFGEGDTRYFRYNIRTGNQTLLFRVDSRKPPIMLDRQTGEVRATQRVEPDGSGDYDIEYELYNPVNNRMEVATGLTSKASTRFNVSVQGSDVREPSLYYVTTDKFRDLTALYTYDIRTNTFSDEPVLAHEEFGVSSVIFSTRSANFGEIVGVGIAGPTASERIYVDPDIMAIYDGLVEAFPGLNVSLTGYNEDFSRVLFTTSSSANPPITYLLVDRANVALVGASRPWIDTSGLRETEFTYYTARDGLKIPAYLTLPVGWSKEQGPIPAVVVPHGGPWARDTNGWDGSGWPQFLASRGYAVLQPQYRGSRGFGRQLWLAGDAQWGLAMQDDKDDGVAWMVEQGIADPARVAMFGYSYGGYAAMAATVRPNGVYRCAIAGAGVSNLSRLGNLWSENRLQRATQGHTVKGLEPIREASKASIPVLVFHGDRDVRVPLFQGRDFYDAVRNYVPAKWLQIPDAPHGHPWPEHRRAHLQAIDDFLRNDCGSGGILGSTS